MASTPTRTRRSANQAAGVESKATKYDGLSREELIRTLIERDAEEEGGIRLSYPGQAPPWQIVRRVQPRRQRIEKKLSVGSEEYQASNIIIDGENLQSMVSLYKYRGQVDLILTDPPYNTGNDFRYNDKWDEDPNDPDLGKLVPADDGSRHCKWLKFMTPRLWMMKEMLKPGGILAICIDQRELFRLGLLLDQVFDESNRLGIINWQKAHSPKNASKHISTATEYILVYSKDKDRAKSGLLPRGESMDRSFKNPDNDPVDEWVGKDPTARENRDKTAYAIQSPFTGMLHYPKAEFRFSGDIPTATAHWIGFTKAEAKKLLAEWGSVYEERDLGDGRGSALVIKGSKTSLDKYEPSGDAAITKAKQRAMKRLKEGNWPKLYFRDTQANDIASGRPRLKSYLKDVKRGKVPLTFWADEEYEEPIILDSQSWQHRESGYSQEGIDELTALVGPDHDFKTVKPLKLFKKVIQLWCPPSGIVLDPFAGSGTTAHAVLSLNHELGARRRFLLIERGAPEKGDNFAKSLTRVRVERAITGERLSTSGKFSIKSPPLEGGFRFHTLLDKIDGVAVLALEREEMLDLLLTSHWDQSERSGCHLQRLPAGSHAHLFAISGKGEGYFLIWNGPENDSIFNREAFKAMAEEAKSAGLKPPYHVYARRSTYSGPNIEFYQIPNRILEKLGFNEATEPFGGENSNA